MSADGKAVLVEQPNYTVEYFDHQGRRRRENGGPDKEAAESLGRLRETEAMERRRGLVDPAAERLAAEARRPISAHLADFKAVLQAKGNTADHCETTHAQAKRIVELCHAEYPADLTASAVQGALRAVRDEGRSLSTCNHYLRSIKSFSRWLHTDKRMRVDALLTLSAFNAATDPRRVRRELTPEEIAWLISTTETRTLAEHRITGPDRAMAYRLALGTGFRAGELRSLTPESFALAGDPPTVTVRAALSKRRREDCQPIRPDLADLLRRWLIGRRAGQPVFSTLPLKTARMLRSDLKAPGRPG